MNEEATSRETIKAAEIAKYLREFGEDEREARRYGLSKFLYRCADQVEETERSLSAAEAKIAELEEANRLMKPMLELGIKFYNRNLNPPTSNEQ